MFVSNAELRTAQREASTLSVQRKCHFYSTQTGVNGTLLELKTAERRAVYVVRSAACSPAIMQDKWEWLNEWLSEWVSTTEGAVSLVALQERRYEVLAEFSGAVPPHNTGCS